MINKTKLAALLEEEGLIKVAKLKEGPRGGVISDSFPVKKSKSKLTVGRGNGQTSWSFSKSPTGGVRVSESGWGGKKVWQSPPAFAGGDYDRSVKDIMGEMVRWLKQEWFRPANYGEKMDYYFLKNRWPQRGSYNSSGANSPFNPSNRIFTPWDVAVMTGKLGDWNNQTALFERAREELGIKRPFKSGQEDEISQYVQDNLI